VRGTKLYAIDTTPKHMANVDKPYQLRLVISPFSMEKRQIPGKLK